MSTSNLRDELLRLKKEDPEKLKTLLDQLTEEEAEALAYDWSIWGRGKQQYNIKTAKKITFWQCSRGWGKDVDQNTKVLTHNRGWTTMGDLIIGDYVYAWDGTPTKVSDIYRPNPRQLVGFTFSDSSYIVSSVEHEWYTNGSVKTTQDIIDTFEEGHSIPLSNNFNDEYVPNNGVRKIVGWRYVDYRPTVCIQVDHEDHLFLLGETLIPTHNTRTGAEAVRHAVEQGCKRIGLIAPTTADVRDTMVLGVSGIMSVFPPSQMPVYEPSYRRVVFHTGAQATLFSAEESSRLRGPQHDFCWMDEPASIKNRDVFDQMMIGNRIGIAKSVVTGTPMVNDIVMELHRRKDKDVEIRYGSIRENECNLADEYVDQIYDMYKGTRLEKTELEGILVLSNPGALWNPDLIFAQTIRDEKDIPDFDKVCIGVDPAVTASKHSDNTGIVISALGTDGKAYVLEDLTGKYSPNEWTNKVVNRYDYYSKFAPTSIRVEKNQGGLMVRETLTRNRPLLPVDDVFSTKSKIARAEPIALLYETGKVFHTKTFSDLEQEMVSYEGKSREKSPDRLDALVFSIMGCMPTKNRVTKEFNFLL